MPPKQGTMPIIHSDDPLSSAAVQDADVIEVPLLLSRWQVLTLEQAAYQRGLTIAEMIRCALRDLIDQLAEQNAT